MLDDALTPAAVVGEQVRQSEPAGQIECGLDGLAHPGAGLVGAEQFDGKSMGLSSDALLERGDPSAQLSIRSRDTSGS